MFLAVVAGQCLFALALVGSSGTSALILSVAFMLVVFGQIPINDVLIGRVTNTEWRSPGHSLPVTSLLSQSVRLRYR